MTQLVRTFRQVLVSVVPIALLVILLELAVTRAFTPVLGSFLGGLALVVGGLTFFLFAVETDLLDVGQSIGSALPRMGALWRLLLAGAVIGLTITVAEPDVRILAQQAEAVSGGHISQAMLVLSIGIGVSISVALAMLRVFLGFSLRAVYLVGYLLVMVLATLAPAEYLSISFDAGGVTTGPVTVPFILALGVGVASVLGGRSTSSDGFGYVGLASVGPIVAVLLLAILAGPA